MIKRWKKIRSILFLAALLIIQIAFLFVCFTYDLVPDSIPWRSPAVFGPSLVMGGFPSSSAGNAQRWLGELDQFISQTSFGGIFVFVLTILAGFALIFISAVYHRRIGETAALDVVDMASTVFMTNIAIIFFEMAYGENALSDAAIEPLMLLAWSLVLLPLCWLLERHGWEKNPLLLLLRLWMLFNVLILVLALILDVQNFIHWMKYSSFGFLIFFPSVVLLSDWRRYRLGGTASLSFRHVSGLLMAAAALAALLAPPPACSDWVRLLAAFSALMLCMDALWLDWRRSLIGQSYAELRNREEEYRLISQYNGKYLMRYHIPSQSLTLRQETMELLDLPRILENASSALLQAQRIAPQSRRNFVRLWQEIESGREGGSTVVGYAHPQNGILWLQTDYITVKDARGRPDHAVLAIHQLEGMQNREKAYRLRRQENDRKAEDGAVYYEIDLTRNHVITTNGMPFFGMPPQPPQRLEELRASLMEDMVPDEYREAFSRLMDREKLIVEYEQDIRVKRIEFPRVSISEQRWTRMEVQLLTDPYSNDVLSFFVFEDIQAERKNREKRRNRADELTGLMGRSAFAESFQAMLKEEDAQSRRHVLLMLDLDGFKAVNDTFGHGFGDKVLVEVAAILRTLLRGDDLICRFGGDEFLMCIKNAPQEHSFVMQKGQKICQALCKQYGDEVAIGASVGAALYPEHGQDFDTLYRRADQALYRAKKTGRNRCVIYDEGLFSADASTQEAPEEPLPDAAGRKPVLLLVDDGQISRPLLKKDYRLLEAKNGDEAFSLLLRECEGISAAIVDVLTPECGGMELLTKMQAHPQMQGVPVVALSQPQREELCTQAIEQGASDFITFPMSDERLLLRVRNAIARREGEKLRNQNRDLLVQRANETRYQSQLQYIAEHDPVTHIYNKSAFFRKTRLLLDGNPNVSYCLMCFDVVRFRAVNDIFGHEEGDRLLRYIAMHLQTAVGEEGTYARVSVDLFALCVPNQDELLWQLMKKIDDHIRRYDLSFEVQLCYGIYRIDNRTLSVNKMLDRAMMAERSVKGSYLTNYAYYDDSMSMKLLEEQRMINDMASALEKQEFVVYYQPKCRLDTGKIVGAEALARWQHPQRGLLSPKSFVPVFEKNGYIMRLDVYMWERVCQFLSERLKRDPQDDLRVSVNLSRANLYNPNICATLDKMCREYGVPNDRMEVEITESAYVENAHLLLDLTEQFHALGFTVEMDDFGSGYSSLNMLNEIPVDVLKLDMRFLYGVHNDKRSGSILTSILEMTRNLKIDVVAEGVETEEQARFLAAIGCRQAQGYYYHRPLPEQEFVGRLEKEQQEENQIHDEEGAKMYLSQLLTSAILVEQKGRRFKMLCANEYYFQLLQVTQNNFSRSDRILNQFIGTTDEKCLLETMTMAKEKNASQECVYVQRDLLSGYHLLRATVQFVTDKDDASLFILSLYQK